MQLYHRRSTEQNEVVDANAILARWN